jgi:hypothetical protein
VSLSILPDLEDESLQPGLQGDGILSVIGNIQEGNVVVVLPE